MKKITIWLSSFRLIDTQLNNGIKNNENFEHYDLESMYRKKIVILEASDSVNVIKREVVRFKIFRLLDCLIKY